MRDPSRGSTAADIAIATAITFAINPRSRSSLGGGVCARISAAAGAVHAGRAASAILAAAAALGVEHLLEGRFERLRAGVKPLVPRSVAVGALLHAELVAGRWSGRWRREVCVRWVTAAFRLRKANPANRPKQRLRAKSRRPRIRSRAFPSVITVAVNAVIA